MIPDQLIVGLERLQVDLTELRSELRGRYNKGDAPVTAKDIKATAARLAEAWMVDFSPQLEMLKVVSTDYLADLTVHFQRLLTLSEHASKRLLYENEIRGIIQHYKADLIISLKRQRTHDTSTITPVTAQVNAALPTLASDGSSDKFNPTAFVAHSFSPSDKSVVDCVVDTLKAIGIAVTQGEKPRAERISEKVKKMIEGQYLFVGLFTRRDKIARKQEWTTSPWLIDEKAYAVGMSKKLLLLKEKGVASIGGIQGDYEFIEFSRARMNEVIPKILQIFDLSVAGLR